MCGILHIVHLRHFFLKKNPFILRFWNKLYILELLSTIFIQNIMRS